MEPLLFPAMEDFRDKTEGDRHRLVRERLGKVGFSRLKNASEGLCEALREALRKIPSRLCAAGDSVAAATRSIIGPLSDYELDLGDADGGTLHNGLEATCRRLDGILEGILKGADHD
jgi:hypothetical protein